VTPPSFLDGFIGSFNPAIAGMRWLLTERLDRMMLRAPPVELAASVNLAEARDQIVRKGLEPFGCFHAVVGGVFNSIISDQLPLIVDSGASCCISPCRDDFVEYGVSTATIKDLSGMNKVAGEGLIRWVVLDRFGREHTVEIFGYHIPGASVRLLSPQAVYQTLGGSGSQSVDKYTLMLPDDIFLDASYGRGNLPILPLASSSGPRCFWSRCFSFSGSDHKSWGDCITAAANQNLSLGQKELLLWHQRLAHANLATVQCLARQRRSSQVSSVDDLVQLCDGPVLPCTYHVPRTSCDNLLCAACLSAKATRRSAGSRPPRPAPAEMILKQGDLAPGDCFSLDHFISPVVGRAVSLSGYSSSRHGYTCGAIYADHASGKLFIQHQHSTAASDTIRGKLRVEQEATEFGVKVKRYHTDNGVFCSAEFRRHCDDLGQVLSFSGVGAHHQNGVAENAIKVVSGMARACLINAQLRWPTRSFIDLWPLAMSYAVWVHNRLPRKGKGLSPDELFSGLKCPRSELARCHVFGCPVYVLDPALQDGKKIPKWDSRARQGIFVGFSDEHSSLVPLVLNPRTQHISPQFHVVFDDAFTTVPALHTVDDKRDELFSELFTTSRDKFIDPSIPVGELELLGDQWLSADELSVREAQRLESLARITPVIGGASSNPPAAPPPIGLPCAGADAPPAPAAVVDLPATHDAPPPPLAPPRVPILPPPAPEGELPDLHPPATSGRPHRAARDLTWRDGPAYERNWANTKGQWKTGFVCLLSLPQYALNAVSTWSQPPPSIANVGLHASEKFGVSRVRHCHINELNLLQGDWDTMGRELCDGFGSAFKAYVSPDLTDEPGSLTVTDAQPHLLTAKATRNEADYPSYRQAMNSPNAEKWFEAMQLEMDTLEKDLKAWSLVQREPWMHVLPSTWAFRLKRYPSGLAKKFKARFCVRGDRQIEGIDFFETWAPVVQWTTVRTIMILAAKLNLVSAQADITAAFVHAELDADEHIFVHQAAGFHRGHNLVYKLNRSVYGLRQSPRNFFQYLKERLEGQGLSQSDLDPCLFIGATVIVVIYVDDVLLYSKNEADINRVLDGLKKDGVSIRREGTAEGFLGVDLIRSGSTITLLQTGLIKRIISAVGLCSSNSTAISTPAEASPLPKDSEGAPASGSFNYAAAVGMLLYLCGHSRPDIAFAVHQCARYTFCPTRRHELALVRIARYLKGTADKGLIMTPLADARIDCYPDADFAGLYGHEHVQDPHCARSRTGYVILAFGCPVLWRSRLQTEIALSTMEAEYVALSTACKDFFPVIDIVKELSSAVGLSSDFVANLHGKIFEDNVGALTLGNLEPRRMTPRSKHYAIKYHWFRERVYDPANRITLVKIDTRSQLGDLFTKGLTTATFVHLRCLLMGW
jgi:hypothetical protein